MDAFFESPKHGSSGSNSSSNSLANMEQGQQQQQQQQLNETGLTEGSVMVVSNSDTIQFNTDNSTTATNTDTTANVLQLHADELGNTGMASHVKLEMENGQVVVVDQSQIETVILVQADGTNLNYSQQQQVGVSLSDTAGILDHHHLVNHHQLVVNNSNNNNSMVDSSLINITSNVLGLDDGEDSNQMDEDGNDVSIKEMDDALPMSPYGFGSLNGISSSPYTMSGSNVSTHTFRKTEWDVKKLENYVRVSFGDSTPMENMQPVVMNRYLVSFFKLAKKSDGMDYEPESLIGFMNSFERYLKTKNYPESLLRSETFKESRTELKKKRDLVRSIGKLIRTKTKDTCYLLQFHRNLLKEKGLLNRDNPDCLLAEIYLNNMIYFGEFLKEDKAWRGNLNLVWGDMLLERDPQNGQEYLTLATYAKKSQRTQQQLQQQQINNQQPIVKTNSRTKTGTQTSKLRAAAAAAAALNAANQSNNSIDANSPRVYARQPASYCPVEAFRIYRTRRPNNCLDRDSPFYLAPLFKSKNQSKVWYKALAMSCQRLDALFYCLFKKAGVDLASLASMSQQQQQQAVAAAASIINNPGSKENQLIQINSSSNMQQQQQLGAENIVGGVQNVGLNSQQNSNSLAQWKAVMKENNNQLPDDVNEMLLNGKSIGDVQNTTSYHGNATFYSNAVSNAAQTVAPPTHHIVTTVPAQVQVQVQVQVQLAQHQQQHVVAANSNATLLVN